MNAKSRKQKGKLLLLTAIAACGVEAGICAYFYRRTMKRSKVRTERTMKMSGTDWNQYMPFIEKRKEQLLARDRKDIYLQSDDGLALHAVWIPNQNQKKVVIGFHGYTSDGMSDFIAISDYYFKQGFSMLLTDARAHGKSEGEYIGFGCPDRYDALHWMNWVLKECGPDTEIILHGISMGGSTVLMASGLDLPVQVKGIVSDCAFTSPKYVFTHVLHTMYHIPAFPIIQIADLVNRRKAGYGLDECNAAREVKKARIPILLIHGEKDSFVPCSMCEEIYENCSAYAEKLLIPGAAHAESYYKDTATYEAALNRLLARAEDEKEEKI